MPQPRRAPHPSDADEADAPLVGWPTLPGSPKTTIARENQRTVETLRDSRQELAHLMRRLVAQDEPHGHALSRPRR